MKTTFLTLVLLFLSFVQLNAQWYPCTSFQKGDDLHSVHFLNAEKGFAIGGEGALLRTTNGGESWAYNKIHSWSTLYSIFFVDSMTAFVAGHDGMILKSTDGGNYWTIQNTGTYDPILTVYFLDANIGYAAGVNIILKTTNGGQNWVIKSSPTSSYCWSIYFFDNNNGYIVGEAGSIIKTTDGGTTWQEQSNINYGWLSKIIFINNQLGFLGGSSGIYRTTNSGLDWIKVYSGSIKSVCFLDSVVGIAVGRGGKILKSTSGGLTWNNCSTPTTNDLFDISAGSSNIFYSVGQFGEILKTTNAGQNWLIQESGLSYFFNEVFFINSNVGYVVGGNGTIIKTSNGGTDWLKQKINTSSALHSVFFSDENNGLAIGNTGIILHTTNGGINWDNINSGVVSQLNAVYFTSIENGYIVGYNGTIIKTVDGGVNWTAQFSGVTSNLNSIVFVNDTTGFIAGDNGIILKTIDGGQNWNIKNEWGGLKLNSISFLNENIGYATGQWFIFKTTNGGENWNGIATIPNPNPFESIFCTEMGGYAVGAGIYCSIDGGNSWGLQYSTYGFLKSITFINENIGFAVGDYGLIVKTSNGGGVLPVELTSFTAITENQKVVLEWTTASELNNNGFEIQRCVAESEFASIGFVKGNGTSTNQNEYTFMDKDLSNRKYFYRLKQVDYDGSYKYSNVIEVDVRSLDEYVLEQNYPNPFNPTTTIGYILKEKTNTKLVLLNAIGEEVMVLLNEEQGTGYHKFEFDASKLSSGIYYYQLRAGNPSTGSEQGFIETKKMILLK